MGDRAAFALLVAAVVAMFALTPFLRDRATERRLIKGVRYE